MEITQRLERASSNTEKKRLLKAENKYLQDNMKQMSENVNLLIEKMNQETLKSKPNKKPQNPNQSIIYDDSLSVATSQIAILKPSKKNRGVSGISSKISQSKKS